MKRKLALITMLIAAPFLLCSQVNRKEWVQAHRNYIVHNSEVVNIEGKHLYASTRADGLYLINVSNGGKPVGYINHSAGLNKPIITRLSDGSWYIFVTSTDGFLYKEKINPDIQEPGQQNISTGLNINLIQSLDLRRPSSLACQEDDKLTCTPVIQLADSSNNQYTLKKDIVIVGTHHGCASATTNMVYAVEAADLSKTVWIFNNNGDYQVDYTSELLLDYSRNAIYFGTNLNAGRYQNTLWRLNTNTGFPDWGINIGSVHSRQILGSIGAGGLNRLYAGTMPGFLYAIDPETGSEKWSKHIFPTLGIGIRKDLVIGEDEYAKTIFVVSTAGNLAAVKDSGIDTPEILWERTLSGGYKFFTSPVLLADKKAGYYKLFAASNYNTVHQLNVTNGQPEGYAVFGNSTHPTQGSDFSDLRLYKDDGRFYKLFASVWGGSGGVTKQFTVYTDTTTTVSHFTGCDDSYWKKPGNWSSYAEPLLSTRCFLDCPVATIWPQANCFSLTMKMGQKVTINNRLRLPKPENFFFENGMY